MLLEIHPYSPQPRLIDKLIEILGNDGVIIYKTDTTYFFGCSIDSKKAMKRIYQIKEIDKHKPLTFICGNAKQFQEYTKGISTPVYRKLKAIVPGPYTFVFEASKLVPKVLLTPRSTIGVRIPDDPICSMLVERLNQPLVSSSVPSEQDQDVQDPYLLHEKYEKLVDCVVDAGEIFITRSAILDFSLSPPAIVRQGDADLSWFDF